MSQHASRVAPSTAWLPGGAPWEPRRWVFRLVVGLVYGFLLVAPLIVIYHSFSPTVVLRFPPDGFTLRWYESFFAQPRLVAGVWNSLVVATVSTAVAVGLGVPAAYGLVRSDLPGRGVLMAFLLSPLNLPGLILALGILMFVARLVQPLVDVTLVGGRAPLMAAHLIVTLPWVVRTVAASLETVDTAPEDAARGLGATPLQTFWLVTLPAIRPGVVAGAIFAFIVSFGNFALSLFFSSGEVVTLPVAIFEYVDQFQDPTVAAVSSVVIVATTLVVLVADRLGARTRRAAAGVAGRREPPA